MRLPKPKTERCFTYLAFIREQPCTICGYLPRDGFKYLMNAHHTETGGMGIKGSDYSAIPLCFACHRKTHEQYGKRRPWTPDELAAIIKRLRSEYEG